MAQPYPTGRVQQDEQGRSYILMSDGSRSYISPVAMGEAAPKDTTSIFRDRPRWNTGKGEWETPISWGNILTLGTAGGLGAGALSALGALGGGGAAGGGGMAAQNVAPFAGLPGAISEPLAGAWNLPTAAAAGGGSGAAAASGAGSFLGNHWDDIAKAGIGAAVGLGAASGAGNSEMPPELRQILDLQRQRLMAGNPLYESVLRLAFSRLPTNATQGLSIPSVG